MVVQIEEGAAFSRAHWLFARAHGRPNGVPGQLSVRAGKGCGWDGNGAAILKDCIGRGFASPEEPNGR